MAPCYTELPNELIIEIWTHVLEPKDVESFALTRKAYALAPKFLREHQRLKDEYSLLVSGENVQGISLAKFLEDILLNPRAALYLDEILLESWRAEWDKPTTLGWNNTNSRHLPYSEETMQLFEGAVKTSAFVPESEATTWITDIRNGDETSILALIMTLCPNVRSFEVDGMSGGGNRLSQTIRRIGKSPTGTALSRLTDVLIGWNDDGLNDFNWVKTLTFLKSVKIIKGRLIGQLEVGFDYWYSLPPRWSNITGLYLEACNTGHQQLYIYLQCLSALETFSYLAVSEDRENPTPFDPFWLCTALTTHAGHSLKKLQMLTLDGMGSHMGSLAGLNVLTELHTEYRMLMDYNPEVYEESLVGMLPSSIEEVILEHNNRYSLDVLQHQILKTCELKAERLPNLKMLQYQINPATFKGSMQVQQFQEYVIDSRIISMLEQRCKQVGVELHIEQVGHE